MDKELKKLSNTELEFMEYVWASDEEKSRQDFISYFSDRSWEKSTISVFLHRLTQKGYLDYYQEGRYSYYTPLISKIEYEKALINQSIKKSFGKPLESVIAAFCGKPTDPKQIERIKDFLKELEEEE